MNDTPAGEPRPAATKPRIRHTMVRVKDLERSVKFYTEVLGMKEFRRSDNESGKYSVVFMGYGDENSDPAIELTYNWGQDDGYELGTGYGHVAIGFPDIYEICKKVEAFGMEVPRPPGPLKGRGPDGPIIAFIRDPDGYSIELGQRA
jgi:lactoylglutathione lyase